MFEGIIIFLVSVFAALIGAVCGVGGGIIIKPVLDALGILDAASASFLSGCTVLSMAAYSVFGAGLGRKTRLNIRMSSALSAGAVMGGIAGKYAFQLLWDICASKNTVGLVQAAALAVITLGALIYTLQKKRIAAHNIASPLVAVVLGALLGILSSFLGIGGGPVNLIVLYHFFSMETKTAAANSIFVILLSQSASLVSNALARTIPDVGIFWPLLMICGGLAGGIIGQEINKRIGPEAVDKLFVGLTAAIICINIYNICRFIR